MFRFRVLAVLSLGLALAGCTGAQKWADNDPLEPFNRQVFRINQSLDRHAALPAAVFYKSSVPGDLRDGVHNVLQNVGLPVTVANDLLQGEASRAGVAAGRFCVNTTIGVLGVMDPATDMGMPLQQDDFGQTLAVYGVPGGPYVVLPLLGATLPRDAVGRLFVDHYFSPLSYFDYSGHYYVSLGTRVFSTVDGRSRAIDRIREIERNSIDQYTAMRDAYLRHREDQIRHRLPSDSESMAN
ncbi:MAG: VacJ family lipoprotein [Alphaproteobacteria bacterium]|nr:VacJ family lipoprotein [Alphaproteobacteria bacterium]